MTAVGLGGPWAPERHAALQMLNWRGDSPAHLSADAPPQPAAVAVSSLREGVSHAPLAVQAHPEHHELGEVPLDRPHGSCATRGPVVVEVVGAAGVVFQRRCFGSPRAVKILVAHLLLDRVSSRDAAALMMHWGGRSTRAQGVIEAQWIAVDSLLSVLVFDGWRNVTLR